VPKRPKRSVKELKTASEHLHYEVSMMASAANGLASGIAGQGNTIANALLESFVLHVRCILDFLYAPVNLRADDVVAQDYFDNPLMWENLRPAMSETLRKARSRAGKEMTHLTYARLDVTSETKPWKFIQIRDEIIALNNAFLQNVDKTKLAGAWTSSNGSERLTD
jgi:hypothetical protein